MIKTKLKIFLYKDTPFVYMYTIGLLQTGIGIAAWKVFIQRVRR